MNLKRLVIGWILSIIAFCLVSGCANQALVTDIERKHTLTIDDMGNVWASGKNDYGQLGLRLPDNLTLTRPIQIPGLQNIVQVYAIGNSSYAIDGTGYLYS